MLYYFLYQFVFQQYGKYSESYFFKGLNVFQYVTFRTAMAVVTSLLISLLLGGKVVRKLADLKFGQEIREEGPASHQEKRGTPTMGGVLIIGSVFLSTVLWARVDSLYLWIALGATTLFGAVGFADDWIKIVKKRSLGLTGRQKIAGQLITALLVWGVLWAWGSYPWNLSIPFWMLILFCIPLPIWRLSIWRRERKIRLRRSAGLWRSGQAEGLCVDWSLAAEQDPIFDLVLLHLPGFQLDGLRNAREIDAQRTARLQRLFHDVIGEWTRGM